MFNHLPLGCGLLIFLASATVIWFAGIQLSKTTDVLDDRLHLGSALGGLIVLAVATNLPEIVITVTAAASGSVEVAVGNILGGIALQTVVIVILDLFGRREEGRAPLTYRAASLTLVVEGLRSWPCSRSSSRAPAAEVAGLLRLRRRRCSSLVLWAAGLLLVRRARHAPAVARGRRRPGHGQRTRSGHGRRPTATRSKPEPPPATVVVFARRRGAHAGRRLRPRAERRRRLDQVGLSGVLFGATSWRSRRRCPRSPPGCRRSARVTRTSPSATSSAATPSCRSCSSSPAGLRQGGPPGGAVERRLPHRARRDPHPRLRRRPALPAERRILGMGIDSLVVLFLYLLGVAGLVGIAR